MTEVAKIDQSHATQVAPVADPMVSMIERLVLNPEADLDKLERMLTLKRDHDRDNARVAFSRALSAARAEIPPIMKDATVDFTNKSGQRTHYQHETLAGIAKVIDPILSGFGLSYRFRTEQGSGGVKVTCVIAHEDGHSEETSLICAPDGSGNKNPFQAVGSAVTYLQRYTLKAALGLSAEVDDDGQAAAPRPQSRQDAPKPQPQPKEQGVSPAQRTADNMVTALRKDGLRITSDPKFIDHLQRMKAEAPGIAAQVEAEIATLKDAQRASVDIDPNEIPY